MNKEKKAVGKIISITITILIVCVVFGVLIYGIQEPKTVISDSNIKIKSMYGLTVDFKDIAEINLIDSTIDDITNSLKRTNGIGNIGNSLKGHFTTDNIGDIMLFIYSGSSPIICIKRINSNDIYINFKDSEKTANLYEELLNKYNQFVG